MKQSITLAMNFRRFHSFCVQTTFLLCLTLLHPKIYSFTIAATVTTTTSTITINTSTILKNETDRLGLLAFKSKIVHDPQGVMSSWNDSLHFCEWQGVTCSRQHQRVTSIALKSSGLLGFLSPFLGNLSFLRELELSNNFLRGSIPPEVGRLFRLEILSLTNNSIAGEIPANLSGCSNLIYLSLTSNFISGKIPRELGSFQRLKALVIERNNLVGSIPASIGNLTSLEAFSMTSNGLEGSIPEALGQLKNLTFLAVDDNKLSGTIPPSIYNLSLITTLALPINQFHGNLPQDIGLTLPLLQNFSVYENHFTGPIPISLSNASNLEYVGMSVNNFTGDVSVFGGLQNLRRLNLGFNNLGRGKTNGMSFLSSLTNCSSLEVLSLAANHFQGILPDSVANLSAQLKDLALGGNQLSGGIPSGIGKLVNLNVLAMERNFFKGSIPTDIGKLQNLRRLALTSNRLSGEIPSSLGNLSLMYELWLQYNNLQGAIPSSIENCKNLDRLDLSHNNLSGTIPKQLLMISSLSIALKLAQNHLVGSLPPEVGNLINLFELDVSENELSGEIPSSLGSCSSLENLYMESNFLEGSIPPSLKSLRGIQNFDLSHNNLSGQIPTFFEIFSLKYLNLSYNNFEGEVPLKGIFANASAISVVANTRLCGGISELRLPRCPIDSKKQKMSPQLIAIISIACGLVGVTLVSSVIYCFTKRKRRKQSSETTLKESIVKVSYEKLLRATDGFSPANLIGVGSFGSVYKGMLDQQGTTVAVKVLNLQHRGASRSFMAECDALRNIRHRNLVKIITSCSSIDFQGNDFKALVYKFIPNGSLETWLHQTPETDDGQHAQILDLHQRINIAIDVACALDYLHNHCQIPVVHCDLKPSNILLDGDMIAHVGDFGLARFLPDILNPHQSSSVGIRGTIGYTPPEYGLGSEVSKNGDVYSYGIMVLEMVTGKRPTDPMFEADLNLHNFAKTALPERVMEILDPNLLLNNEAAAAVINHNNNQRHAGNESRKECLISMIKIGLACSNESPHDRMEIASVINEMQTVKNFLFWN